jgi:hypothetical protein
MAAGAMKIVKIKAALRIGVSGFLTIVWFWSIQALIAMLVANGDI